MNLKAIQTRFQRKPVASIESVVTGFQNTVHAWNNIYGKFVSFPGEIHFEASSFLFETGFQN